MGINYLELFFFIYIFHGFCVTPQPTSFQITLSSLESLSLCDYEDDGRDEVSVRHQPKEKQLTTNFTNCISFEQNVEQTIIIELT